jgi:hypothetical protein
MTLILCPAMKKWPLLDLSLINAQFSELDKQKQYFEEFFFYEKRKQCYPG